MSYQKYNPKRDIPYTSKQSVIFTPPDKTVLIVVAFLVTIGIIAIFSASAPKCMEMGQNPARFALFQIFFLIIGLLGMPSEAAPYYSLIVDGIHSHPYTVKFAEKANGKKCVLITDAMAAMGLGEGHHKLGKQNVIVKNQYFLSTKTVMK